MPSEYVRRVDGVYRVGGTRVSLDSVVYGFLEGQSAETIAQSFPALTLEQVYGSIAYYLGHRAEVDAYLRRAHEDFERQSQLAREKDPMFYQKLADAKRARALL